MADPRPTVGRHHDEVRSALLGRPGDTRGRLSHSYLGFKRQEAAELFRHDRMEPGRQALADAAHDLDLRLFRRGPHLQGYVYTLDGMEDHEFRLEAIREPRCQATCLLRRA